MNRSVRPSGARVPLLLICMLAALVAWVLVAAGPAAAAPTEPTMSLDDLRAAITTAGPGGLDGYFNTVLQGATITPVSVKILAVADGQNPQDGSALILFQITDPTVVSEGGLAEGMSGSPLFVGDASDPQPTDDLVGAASYGDMFTTNGLGLATPIDNMAAIETKYSVAPLALGAAGSLAAPSFHAAGAILPKTRTAVTPRRVRTAAGSLDRFVVARSRTVARTLHPAAGTAVFVPLSVVEIGGLPSGSKAFKRLAADFAKHGVDVRPVGAGLGASADSDFSTDLVGGASVAAVLSSGDMWAAYFGTVTYAHDNVVVAFGHPANFDGPSGLDMANANVYGIWSDSLSSYKLFSLGARRGLITQDRSMGIAGELYTDIPADTPEVPVDASATLPSSTPLLSHTDVPLWVADNPDYGADLIDSACYFPVWMATDSYSYPGHALIDSKVTVADPTAATPTTYTTEMNNVFDDTYDVGFWAGEDVYTMLSVLLSNPNGTAPATASSVTCDTQLSPDHASLQVLDFAVPGGLKHGANTIRTFVRAYGEKGTHEEDVTLNVPAYVATTGFVSVYDSNGIGGGDPSDWYYDGPRQRAGTLGDASTIPDSETLPDLVSEVDSFLLNDSLNVTFEADVPNDFVVPIGPDGQPINIVSATRAVIENGTTWFVQGSLSKETPFMRLRPRVPVVAPKHYVKLSGFITAEDSNATRVAIYRGSSATPFANVPVHVTPDGTGVFSVKVKLGTSTTSFKAVWGGSDSYIGATTSCKVRVLH